jgi:hypothetical protein
MIEIGFTGTRRGMTEAQRHAVTEFISGFDEKIRAHHGVCEGADAEFHQICREFDAHIKGHPPVDKRYMVNAPLTFEECADPKPYLVRNKEIVNESELLIATPRQAYEVLRSGTWSTVRYARRQSKPVIIVFPNGSISSD